MPLVANTSLEKKQVRRVAQDDTKQVRRVAQDDKRTCTQFARFAACAVLLGCAASGSGPAALDGKLQLGTWGGDNAGMMVSDTAMHLHVGCTYGDVSGRIALAADGSFDVVGSYMLRAYPITIGPSVPARFHGRVDGAAATVTVTVNDTVQHATVSKGPVSVKFGDEPRMGPCPICRRPIITMRP